MKKIILSAALTAALASPAFSQATPMLTQPQAYASERVQPGPYSRYNGQRGYAQQGYAPGVVSRAASSAKTRTGTSSLNCGAIRSPTIDRRRPKLAKPGLAPGFALLLSYTGAGLV